MNALALLLLSLSAHAAEGALAKHTVEHAGKTRTYFLVEPSVPSKKPVKLPLLVALHGGLGDGEKLAAQTLLPAVARERAFLLALPSAIDHHWDDGRPEAHNAYDDEGFLLAVVKDVEKTHDVDESRVFVAGISNGGLMTLRLACSKQNVFTGYGVLSANLPKAQEAVCAHPPARNILLLHSESDPLVPWNGGRIKGSKAFGGLGGEVISFPATVDLWRKANSCKVTEEPETVYHGQEGCQVERLGYHGCGRNLRVFRLSGTGHGWPGGVKPGALARLLVGPHCEGWSANLALADFFGL